LQRKIRDFSQSIYLQTKNTSRFKPLDKSPPQACIEMNSIFYDVLMQLKKVSQFKKYFDQHCFVACFETLF